MNDRRADYAGASASAIRHHYDLGNDFFALWLDASRTYSCALWGGGDDTLEAAQERKIDHLVHGARAVEAKRVLDIGCGWGSMLRRLVEHHGVEHVVGLTLSQAQAEYVSSWGDARYDVRVENWADHVPDRPYGAIISIGAFEHFAGYGLPREARIEAYRSFFDSCRAWLVDGGRLALQTIVKGNNVQLGRRMTRDMLFVIERIFRESELPWPSEIFQGCERRFDLVSARSDGPHYARTCRHWLTRLADRRDEAEDLVGSATVDDYERYLRASIEAFDKRHVGLMRIVLERV
jgi:cyclopropane-fatty-acyl-phospholipid synthase